MNSSLKKDNSILFTQFEVFPELQICIVIPVKNEEKDIEECLASFLNQIDDQGRRIDCRLFEILVLANNCTDKSVQLITDFKDKNPHLTLHLQEIVLENEQANIGFVRRTLMNSAYARLNRNGGGIIMTTDGDTAVSENWIWQNSVEIKNGADAVGGRILFKTEEKATLDAVTALLHDKDEKYHLLVTQLESLILKNFDHQKEAHHQHFNGSFAVTTDCYKKSGGIPEVRHLEDCAFFQKLQRIDAKVRHSTKVQVKTSARFFGRTEIGLSHQLNCWKNTAPDNANFPVESCESIVDRLLLKKKLSDLWNNRHQEYDSIITNMKKADEKIVITTELILKFFSTQYFGEWFDEVNQLNEKNWREKFAAGLIDEEVVKLQQCIKNYKD